MSYLGLIAFTKETIIKIGNATLLVYTIFFPSEWLYKNGFIFLYEYSPKKKPHLFVGGLIYLLYTII